MLFLIVRSSNVETEYAKRIRLLTQTICLDDIAKNISLSYGGQEYYIKVEEMNEDYDGLTSCGKCCMTEEKEMSFDGEFVEDSFVEKTDRNGQRHEAEKFSHENDKDGG